MEMDILLFLINCQLSSALQTSATRVQHKTGTIKRIEKVICFYHKLTSGSIRYAHSKLTSILLVSLNEARLFSPVNLKEFGRKLSYMFKVLQTSAYKSG